ncbi:hypothetical protein FACS189499_02350 [Clostridia bacterium]|nr:hypothetical protein FACS189499_02350 [Clostridia bacterium]
MEIYVDVLIVINLYVTFFLLSGTARFLHMKTHSGRLLLGAAFGGICSLLIFAPDMNVLLNIAVKLLSALVIIIAAFGFKKKLKIYLTFILTNVIFAGIMLAVELFISPLGMVYSNGIAYFDINFAVIVISTLVSYFAVRLLRYKLDIKFSSEKEYIFSIIFPGGECISAIGKIDTGNNMTDFFTGLPVIILNRKYERFFSGKRTRLLPYSTIGNSGLMQVLRPKSITVRYGTVQKNIPALIGLSPESITDAEAIFSPKILL